MLEEPKVIILTNIIAPYRLPIYFSLADSFRTGVIFSGWEDNRDFWQQELAWGKKIYTKKAWGFKLKIPVKRSGQLFDYWYLHINPGYLVDLIKIRPDAVISNEMGFRTLMALIYGSVFGRPVWVCWEGTLFTEKNIGIAKKVLRSLIARWVNRWISFGATSTEYLLSLGIYRERILQTQNCIDEVKFTDSAIVPGLELIPKPVVLCAGQLINRKGVKQLLEAAARVQQEGYGFSLLLVGGGTERERLEEYAEELDLKNVHFHPPVKPSAMAGIYKSADLFVLPTLHDVWGLVVNEALWSGLPVLCSCYAGARELLPGENIFDPLDPADFAAALKRAVRGEISPPNYNRLKTMREVSQQIAGEIKGALGFNEDSGFS